MQKRWPWPFDGRTQSAIEKKSSLNGVELPAFAEGGFQQLVGVRIVGDLHLVRIVFELAFMPQRDHSEQHPLDKWRGHIEVRASWIAALADALYRQWPTIAAPSIRR